jgi:hypothetical protein
MDTRCLQYPYPPDEAEIRMLRQLVLGQRILVTNRTFKTDVDTLERLERMGQAYRSFDGETSWEYRATPEAMANARAEWARRRCAKELVPVLPRWRKRRLTPDRKVIPDAAWLGHQVLIALQEPGGVTINEDHEASSRWLTDRYVTQYCAENHLRRW